MKRSTMFTLNLGLSFGLLSRFTSAMQIICPDLKSISDLQNSLIQGCSSIIGTNTTAAYQCLADYLQSSCSYSKGHSEFQVASWMMAFGAALFTVHGITLAHILKNGFTSHPLTGVTSILTFLMGSGAVGAATAAVGGDGDTAMLGTLVTGTLVAIGFFCYRARRKPEQPENNRQDIELSNQAITLDFNN